MDDSWPASPRADELSDSISRHAAEIERTLLALEAVEAFRAEAAALRAELHAAKTAPGRRPPFRPLPAPEISPGAWRLMVECGFLVGVAIAAWAFRLDRLEIIIAMGAAWLLVAVVEAVAWRRSEFVYPFSPPLPARPPVHAAPAPPVSAPVPAADPWPEPSEPVELTTVLPPEPEPAPEPEPEVAEAEVAPEEPAPPPARRRLPRFGRRREQTPA
jgi:hypothetical protein